MSDNKESQTPEQSVKQESAYAPFTIELLKPTELQVGSGIGLDCPDGQTRLHRIIAMRDKGDHYELDVELLLKPAPVSSGDAIAEIKPQLAYSARQMLEAHIAKYNDPNNEEWDWDDIHDKWERHAFSAFMDLQSAEAENKRLLDAYDAAAKRCQCACHDFPEHTKLQDVADANRYHAAEVITLRARLAEVEAALEFKEAHYLAKINELIQSHATAHNAAIDSAIATMRESLTTQFNGFTNADELVEKNLAALAALKQKGNSNGK